jgi:molecular chaperone DnaK
LDLLKDRFATARLMEQAERVKVELTNTLQTEVNLPYIAMLPEKGPLHINMHMSRAKFEGLVEPHFKRILPLIEDVLKKAEVNKNRIDVVLLSGGKDLGEFW